MTVKHYLGGHSSPKLGFGKRGLLEKGSFQESPFSRDSREFRDSRVFRKPPDCGKQRRFRPFSRDSRGFRDFRDSRDFSSEKTPFVMTPFSVPEKRCHPGWFTCRGPTRWNTHTQELCDTLQDALIDTVRQLLVQSILTADHPDPPILVFFCQKKNKDAPKNAGISLSAEPLKSLEKKGKTQKKNKEGKT